MIKLRTYIHFIFSGLLLLAAGGCVAMSGGSGYLDDGEYAKGESRFEEKVKQDAEDASSQYYLGRLKLAQSKPQEAMPHLEKAVALDPKSVDYAFWKGVCHWSLGQTAKERESYRAALRILPSHIPSRLYLGHNYLDQGDAAKALKQYAAILKWDPYHPEALYNRAMALRKLGKSKSEIVAWRTYLQYYPDGSLGREAAFLLNTHGDFAFRTHLIGVRQITLDSIRFKTGTSKVAKLSAPALKTVGELMSKNPGLTLEIGVFVDKNEKLAKERAQSVRDTIVAKQPGISPERFVLHGYGRPEKIRAGGKLHFADNTVMFKTVSR